MTDINRNDLKTILAFALHVAKVDQDLATVEKEVLRRYIDVTHLSPEERAELAGGSISLAQALDDLSGEEARRLLVKTLCAVAYSDGVRHRNELEFIDRVNRQLGGVVALKPWDEWRDYEQEVLAALGNVE